MNEIADALTTALQELPAAVRDDPALWGEAPEKKTTREVQSTLSDLVSESARYVIRRRVVGHLDAITAGVEYGDDVSEFLSGLEIDFTDIDGVSTLDRERLQDVIRDAIGKAIAAQVRVKLTDPEWMPVARGDARLAHMHEFIDRTVALQKLRDDAGPAAPMTATEAKLGQDAVFAELDVLAEHTRRHVDQALKPMIDATKRLAAAAPLVDEWGEPIEVPACIARTEEEIAAIKRDMAPSEPTIFDLLATVGMSDAECGAMFGVSRTTYNNHKRGKPWAGPDAATARAAIETIRQRIETHEAIIEKLAAFVPDTYE